MGNNDDHIFYDDIGNIVNGAMVLLQHDGEYWNNPTNQFHQRMIVKDHVDTIQCNHSKMTTKQKSSTILFHVYEPNYDGIVV